MRLKALAVMAVLAPLLWFVGSFHVVTSDGRTLPELVPRVTFAFREFVVNQDALIRMPTAVRMTQYPLASMALERRWQQQIEEGRELSKQ